MKQHVRLFLFGLLVGSSGCGQAPAGAPSSNQREAADEAVTFAHTASPPSLGGLGDTVLPNTSAESDIEADINGASSSVSLGIYEFDTTEIADTLVAAHDRGVNVRVVINGTGNTTKINQGVVNELTNAGITVVDAVGFSYYHAKYLIIDDSYALVMTCNWSKASFTTDREVVARVTDSGTVNELQSIFDADFAQSGSTPALSGTTALVVSPVNSRNQLSDLINSTAKVLWIGIEELNDKTMVANLVALAQNGVCVNVILPTKSRFASNATPAATLESGGVNVRALSQLYPHEKVIVTDTLAYVGSVNLSATSMGKNREIGIIGSGSFRDDMLAELEADWPNATKY